MQACSDDEVIFVRETKVVSVANVSVKTEPKPARAEQNCLPLRAGKARVECSEGQQEQTGGDGKDRRNGDTESTVDVTVTASREHIGTGGNGQVFLPATGTVAEQRTDELDVAINEVVRMAEVEQTIPNENGAQFAVLHPGRNLPQFKNVFTPQFIGPPKFLETSKLSGRHLWDSNELRNIAFHHWVTNNPNRRTDMQFFHELHEFHPSVAKNSWAQLRENVRYVIPETLQCSRSFAREMLEVHYLDRMDVFLETVKAEEISVCNIPLLQDRVTDREWNVFAKRPGHFQELFNRREHRLWLPHDQPEIATYAIEDLRNDYPHVDRWFLDLEQPSGLPIPCPPVVYYYHNELVSSGQGHGYSTILQKLQSILRLEFGALFLCTWFMECALGGRHFLLKHNTIEEIAQCVGGRHSFIRDMSTARILDLMRQGRMYDSQLYNFFRYVKTKDEYYNMYREHEPPLPDCIFLSCYKGSGIIKTRASGAQVAYQSLWCRRMNMALKQAKKSEREWISPLDAILSSEDLDGLPELRALIRARSWDQNTELCVYDLLQNLIDMTSRSVQTNLRISSGSNSLRKERDSLLRIINNAIDGPSRDIGFHRHEDEGGRGVEPVQNYGTVNYDRGSNRNTWTERDHGYRSNHNERQQSRNAIPIGMARRGQSDIPYDDYGCVVRRHGSNVQEWQSEYRNRYQESALKRPKIVGTDRFENAPLEEQRLRREAMDNAEPRYGFPSTSGDGVTSPEKPNNGENMASGYTPEKLQITCANDSRASRGNDVARTTRGNEIPSGVVMPAFQPRSSSWKRKSNGESSFSVARTIDDANSRPGTPATPIVEVDISRNDSQYVREGITSDLGAQAEPQCVPRHPWGFALK